MNVVYIPGLGGGKGYSYLENLLRGTVERMKSAGKLTGSVEDAVGALKNTILVGDDAGPFTVAHELGHVMTGSGHVAFCSDEDRKDDPDGCALQDRNLMLPDGRYGTLLDRDQCRQIRSTIRRGRLDRPSGSPVDGRPTGR